MKIKHIVGETVERLSKGVKTPVTPPQGAVDSQLSPVDRVSKEIYET